ncbi:MAG: rhodanese-like domain-containing protein [Gammaproteobacteria bacterium]|nr:rhodanese-like domain-containing protein [Gammaproteobacteria bacterium]
MKIIYYSLLIIFAELFLTHTVWAEKPFAPKTLPGTIQVNAEETVELIMNMPNLLVIDTRKETEYTKGHIQGSISLSDTEMTLEKLSQYAPNKSQAILFYCNGERCLRSSNAAKKALKWDYKLIYWFRTGWNEWVKKGMPISR